MSSFQDFQVVAGCVISSPSSDFEVQAVLGSGSFGEVAQCRKRATGETVALKVLKEPNCIREAEKEVTILTTLRKLHCDKFNIVRWNDSFGFQGRFCLEFEKLDISLSQFLRQNNPLFLMEIRPILQQLATALEFLWSWGIIHADLKPENIMMVDHVRQPFKVKVIDFGWATHKPTSYTGITFQTLWYRSPEVLLGTPINEAVDVWSLGCIAAELLMGTPLFRARNEDHLMRQIVQTVGMPPVHLLNTGLYTHKFFFVSFTGKGERTWSLRPQQSGRGESWTRPINSLSDLMKIQVLGVFLPGDDSVAQCDLAAFVQLLTEMLRVGAAERITPSKILEHPFISMEHLKGTYDGTFHVALSLGLMDVPVEETRIQETANSSPGPSVRVEEPDIPQTIPGLKRKRSADGDSEEGHGSLETPSGPRIKRRRKRRRRRRRRRRRKPLGTEGRTSSWSPGPNP